MRQQRETDTGEKPGEDGDKDGTDVATSLGMPGAPQHWKSQGRVLP